MNLDKKSIKAVTQYQKEIDIKRVSFILKNLSQYVPENAKVLDVGCGNGNISRALGCYGYQVLGVDISNKAIKKAKQLNSLPNVQFEVKSAEEIQKGEEKYDAIVCSEVLEHLDNPSSLVEVLYSILKPTGILIVTVPNGRGPRELFVTRPMLWLRNKNAGLLNFVLSTKKALGYRGTTVQSDAENLDHVQFFTKRALTNLLEKNSFKNITFSHTNFIEDVFPFSFLTKKIHFLQNLDCKAADLLPHYFTGGFNTAWKKSNID